MDIINSNYSTFLPGEQESSHSAVDSEEDRSKHLCRVWLLSHHIYDKVKRRKLLELSLEKSIGGFTLPGKPGVICLEGSPEDCAEAVAVIKSWNWQKICIKFEEKTTKCSRFNGTSHLFPCIRVKHITC